MNQSATKYRQLLEMPLSGQAVGLTVTPDSNWYIYNFSIQTNTGTIDNAEKLRILNNLSRGRIATFSDSLLIDQNTTVVVTFLPMANFTPVTNVGLGATVTSNAIVATGNNTAIPISISGGYYSIDGGLATNLAGTVNPGQAVTVVARGADTYLTTTSATLNIGGVTTVFTLTTRPVTYDVVVTKTGSGNITSTDSAINCGIDCTQSYPDIQTVLLIVTAESGWHITGFSIQPSALDDIEKMFILKRLTGEIFTTFSGSILLDQAKAVSFTFSPIP